MLMQHRPLVLGLSMRCRYIFLMRQTQPPSATTGPLFGVELGEEGGRGSIVDVCLSSPPMDVNDQLQDRFRFDNDDEEETPIHYVNPYDSLNIKHRAEMWIPHREMAAAQPAAQAQAQAANRRPLTTPQADLIMVNGRSTAGSRSESLGSTAVRPTPSRLTS